jgi:salicylate hydroxylase
MAKERWKAPYLVVHRADLQNALMATASQSNQIELTTGARVTGLQQHANWVEASVNCADHDLNVSARMLVGADGVWSAVRSAVRTTAPNRFTGELAWRTTIALDEPTGKAFAGIANADAVTAFLHSRFHLIAYPISAGTKINLVAFTKGERIADSWSGNADINILAQAMRNTSPKLRELVHLSKGWTAWPLHSVDPTGAWTAKSTALIGDAAHAMTPFAAQGAAMAIEDAALLADCIASDDELATALSVWEQQRKDRVNKVVKRGALNHLAWHAAGPVALTRNLVLKLRSSEKLAADLDWLYGWRLPESGSVKETATRQN